MTTRPAAVAGMFYPAPAHELQTLVNTLLQSGQPQAVKKSAPKVLVVPHAGYIYSGSTAASAYNLLKPYADQIRRVVLLGPAHRVALRGMALPSNDHFETPLGKIRLDTNAINRLKQLPAIDIFDAAHTLEHSLEVQLPFLQTVLSDFTLIPIVVGDTTPEEVKTVINDCWQDDTLFVISTDLSHFLNYNSACTVDNNTINHILAFDNHLHGEQACGCRPLNGMLLTAKEKKLQIDFIGYCNSGDTAGDKERVVGYAAFSLY